MKTTECRYANGAAEHFKRKMSNLCKNLSLMKVTHTYALTYCTSIVYIYISHLTFNQKLCISNKKHTSPPPISASIHLEIKREMFLEDQRVSALHCRYSLLVTSPKWNPLSIVSLWLLWVLTWKESDLQPWCSCFVISHIPHHKVVWWN